MRLSGKLLAARGDSVMPDDPAPESTVHKRRRRYRGKNPRHFEDKYKERDPRRYAETVAKVLAAGRTPAGAHRPIMVPEILEVMKPEPGDVVVDATLGYGGHAQEILKHIQPRGRLLGLDVDPLELPKTEARFRALGFGPETFTAHRSNFAGLMQVLVESGLSGADAVLADLGVSSMQLDDPQRGFSFKHDGPLDMRMNPRRGQSAAVLLQKIEPGTLRTLLIANADEPHATALADLLAGKDFATTAELSAAVRNALPRIKSADRELSVRRVFQALRIAVNDEFSALESFLRQLPACLNAGGRCAILTFHSGEDRRVKKALENGWRDGLYSQIATEVIRPTPQERHANPRSASAKLRWAYRSDR